MATIATSSQNTQAASGLSSPVTLDNQERDLRVLILTNEISKLSKMVLADPGISKSTKEECQTVLNSSNLFKKSSDKNQNQLQLDFTHLYSKQQTIKEALIRQYQQLCQLSDHIKYGGRSREDQIIHYKNIRDRVSQSKSKISTSAKEIEIMKNRLSIAIQNNDPTKLVRSHLETLCTWVGLDSLKMQEILDMRIELAGIPVKNKQDLIVLRQEIEDISQLLHSDLDRVGSELFLTCQLKENFTQLSSFLDSATSHAERIKAVDYLPKLEDMKKLYENIKQLGDQLTISQLCERAREKVACYKQDLNKDLLELKSSEREVSSAPTAEHVKNRKEKCLDEMQAVLVKTDLLSQEIERRLTSLESDGKLLRGIDEITSTIANMVKKMKKLKTQMRGNYAIKKSKEDYSTEKFIKKFLNLFNRYGFHKIKKANIGDFFELTTKENIKSFTFDETEECYLYGTPGDFFMKVKEIDGGRKRALQTLSTIIRESQKKKLETLQSLDIRDPSIKKETIDFINLFFDKTIKYYQDLQIIIERPWVQLQQEIINQRTDLERVLIAFASGPSRAGELFIRPTGRDSYLLMGAWWTGFLPSPFDEVAQEAPVPSSSSS